MFKNIGKKIKTLATVICIIEFAASVIIGMSSIGYNPLISLAIICGGALLSWIGSFFMYGFGELIDNSTQISEAVSRGAILGNAKNRPLNPDANEWKCPSCGNINQNYVGTCSCGQKKP